MTTIVSFSGAANGTSPSGLIQGNDGSFYGTTSSGGSANFGTIFRMTPAGVLTTLASFNNSNGSGPTAGLVQGNDGNLYGTTENGGFSGDGVIFQLAFPPAAAPVFDPMPGTYANAQAVTISTTASGAFISYTTDGSTPTETNGTLYSNQVNISSSTALNAIAYGNGFSNSPVTNGIYTIGNSPPPQVAAPVFGPMAGAYTSAQTVTITSTTSGAAIRYTTDGSTPTETNGTLYPGSVTISSTTILNAIAYESGFPDSPVTNGIYTITIPPPQVAAPTFSPAFGTYTSAQTVTITSATSGASIRYTTDGSIPTETNGTLYSSSRWVSATRPRSKPLLMKAALPTVRSPVVSTQSICRPPPRRSSVLFPVFIQVRKP